MGFWDNDDDELNNDMFHSDDLELVKWQYLINLTHKDIKVGDVVFLKSNPELPLLVHKVKKNNIQVTWLSDHGNISFEWFNPVCLMLYKYAGLKRDNNNKFKISLN